jgi:hypothetical protein
MIFSALTSTLKVGARFTPGFGQEWGLLSEEIKWNYYLNLNMSAAGLFNFTFG